MPELDSLIDERYCRLRAEGFSALKSYAVSRDYAKGRQADPGNTSRYDRRPHIQERTKELRAEIEAALPDNLDDVDGVEGLRLVARKGVADGNLGAAATAYKLLAEYDGSGDKLASKNSAENVTDHELAAIMLPAMRRYDVAMNRKLRPDHEITAGILRSLGADNFDGRPSKPPAQIPDDPGPLAA